MIPTHTDLVTAFLRGAPPVLNLQETFRRATEVFVQALSGPLAERGFDAGQVALAAEQDLRNLSRFALNTSGKAENFWDRINQSSNPFLPERISPQLRNSLSALTDPNHPEYYKKNYKEKIRLLWSKREALAATATDEGTVAVKIVAGLGDIDDDQIGIRLAASAACAVDPSGAHLALGIDRGGIVVSSMIFTSEIDPSEIDHGQSLDQYFGIKTRVEFYDERNWTLLSDVEPVFTLHYETPEKQTWVELLDLYCDGVCTDDPHPLRSEVKERGMKQLRGIHLGIGRLFSHFETDPTP
jgi:hypothetical protein